MIPVLTTANFGQLPNPSASGTQISNVSDRGSNASSVYESNLARLRNQTADGKGCGMCGYPRGPGQLVRNDALCKNKPFFKKPYSIHSNNFLILPLRKLEPLVML